MRLVGILLIEEVYDIPKVGIGSNEGILKSLCVDLLCDSNIFRMKT